MATLPTAPLNWAAPRYYDQPSPFALAHFRLDGEILEPANLAEIRLPETLVRQRNHGVVFSGRGPLWLYGHLVHLAHAFAWVGVYDPRLSGAVVVMRHTSSAPPLGQVIACAPYEDVTPRGRRCRNSAQWCSSATALAACPDRERLGTSYARTDQPRRSVLAQLPGRCGIAAAAAAGC